MTSTSRTSSLPDRTLPRHAHANAWVPGRLIGGLALVVGPAVWFAGLLVRYLGVATADFTPQQQAQFDGQMFDAPEQLAAYVQNPALVTAGYALFAGGAILMFPAAITFARIVASGSPRLAFLGSTLFVASLFARLYFAGIDLTAFELVDRLGLQQATTLVLDSYVDLSYGLWRIPVTASVGAIVGMLILALAAYRAGTIGLGRSLLLVLFGWIFLGVLKDSGLDVLQGGVPACLVFIPFGIAVLRDRIPQLRRTVTMLAETEQTRRRLLSW